MLKNISIAAAGLVASLTHGLKIETEQSVEPREGCCNLWTEVNFGPNTDPVDEICGAECIKSSIQTDSIKVCESEGNCEFKTIFVFETYKSYECEVDKI